MAPLMTLNDWILYKNGYLYDNSGNFLSRIKFNPTKKTMTHTRNIHFFCKFPLFFRKKKHKINFPKMRVAE
jgi:hypothetical protein